MKEVEKDLARPQLTDLALQTGHLKVNAPLPVNFNQLFSSGVAQATGCREGDVKVVSSKLLARGDVGEVFFQGPRFAVVATEEQASDPDSKLARGPLRLLLTAREDHPPEEVVASEAPEKEPEVEVPGDAEPQSRSIDMNLDMPYGDLEPFGREDTAQELTQASIEESDRMVDQLERAEVAEEKRAIFRALTRLRGAAITSFDGVARAQTGNIDEYNKVHRWRSSHPVQHLANEESDISKWAFPDF